MAKLFLPNYQFTDGVGNPVAGGGVFFSTTGGNTAKGIYTDTALSVAATNVTPTTAKPGGQPLDAQGRFSQGDLYGSGDYRVTVRDAAGAIITGWPKDDYTPDAVIDEGLDTQWTYNQTTDIITGTIDDVDAIKFGRQDVADTGLMTIDGKAYTADTTENTHIVAVLATNKTTIPSGTTSLASSLYLVEPNLTATGTITNAATLYIKDAPDEGGSNYALWVDDGAVQFDSTLVVTGATTFTGLSTHGGAIVSDTDSTDDIGTTGVRWKRLYVDSITLTSAMSVGADPALSGALRLSNNETISSLNQGGGADVVMMRCDTSSRVNIAPNGDITRFGGDLSIVGGDVTMTAGLLTVGGRTIVNDTTDATTGTNGSLQTDGGLSVVKKAWFGDDITIPATGKIYLDGGGDTYIHELGANSVVIRVGGANTITATATQTILVGDLTISAGKATFVEIANNEVLQLGLADQDVGFINFAASVPAGDNTSPLSSWVTSGADIVGHIQIEVNGASFWLKYYDDPLS